MHVIKKVVLVSVLASVMLMALELFYALISGARLVKTASGIALFLLLSLLLCLGWGVVAGLVQGVYLSAIAFLYKGARKRWHTTRVRLAVSVIFTATLLPYVIYFSQRLFSGEGISRFAYVSYLRAGFVCFGIIVIYVLASLVVRSLKLWFSQGNRLLRKVSVFCGLAVLLFLYAVNAELYVGQYEFVHQALSLCIFLIAEFIIINLLGEKRLVASPRNGIAKNTLYVIVFLLPLGIAIFAFVAGGIIIESQQLSYIYSQLHLGKQVVWIYKLKGEVGTVGSSHYEEYIAERDAFVRSAPSMRRKGYNFIWIMVDAFRADHLPMYGYKRNTSPRLKKLAQKSLLFFKNYTQGPNTPTSLCSQMTGCYRSTIRRGGGINKLDTLPEMLLRSGYQTWAVAQRLDMHFLREKGKEGVAFEDIELADMLPAPEVNKKAIELLENREEETPFFMFLFYYEPHEPYEKHAEFDYGSRTEDFYDSEISYVDKYIGELLDYLKQNNFDRNTILLVTADHGDEMGQHGGTGHYWKMHDCLIYVPFILYIPDAEPMVISTPIQSIDMCPSMVELLDLKTDAQFDGSSFLPYIAKVKPPYNPQIFSEAECQYTSKVCLIYYPWKLVYHISESYFEFFNLENDPMEKVNRVGDSPEIVALLKKKLLSWLSYRDQRYAAGRDVEDAAVKDLVDRLHNHDSSALEDLRTLEGKNISKKDFEVINKTLTPYFSKHMARFLMAQAEKNEEARVAAASALSSLVKRANDIRGGTDSVLGETLGTPQYDAAVEIFNELSGEDHADFFLFYAFRGDDTLSKNCLEIIGVLKLQSARDRLFELYEWESNPDKKKEIFQALCRLGDPRVEEELFEGLEEKKSYRELKPMIPLTANCKSERCREFLLWLLPRGAYFRYQVVIEIGRTKNTYMLPVLKAIFYNKEGSQEVSDAIVTFTKKMAILHYVDLKGRENLSADDRRAIREAYEKDVHLAQFEKIRKLYESLWLTAF